MATNEIGKSNEKRVTGTLIAYYFICKRKLWLHAKGLDLENVSENADVIKGKIIHETRFKREKNKDFSLDNVKIDFLKFGDEVFVHEVKKSRKFEEAHLWQLKFYIYSLYKSGINCMSGVLHYPASMKKIEISLGEEDVAMIEATVKDIQNLLRRGSPPGKINKKFCKKCAYFDFCYA